MAYFDLDNPGCMKETLEDNMQEINYIDRLTKRRERKLSGKLNAMPFPFKRASYYFPGLELGTYAIVTGETKHAKTSIATYAFLLSQLWLAYNNPTFKVKYLYFNAEESREVIKDRIVCFLLNKLTGGKIRISTRDLTSTTMPLSQEILDTITSEKFQEVLNFFLDRIEFNDITYPTGISIAIDKFVEENGTKQKGDSFVTENNITGKKITKQKIIGYTHNDPDTFKVIFFDNFNNITPEQGQTLLQAITVVSKNLKDVRNKYNFIIIGIQQQNSEGDSNDAFKIQKLEPSISRLQDCRMTSRDCQVAIGIYCPTMKFEGLPNGDARKEIYCGYNIKKLGTYFRSIHLLLDRNGECAKAFPMFFDPLTTTFEELPPVDNEAALQAYYQRVEQFEEYKRADMERKEAYKRTHGLSMTFIGFSKNYNKIFAKLNIKEYLCKTFHKLITH